MSSTPIRPTPAPLAVPPREACLMLSVGMSRLYKLLRTGELESYLDGRARRITTASIHQRMARQIADSAEKWHPLNPQPSQRRKAREVGAMLRPSTDEALG